MPVLASRDIGSLFLRRSVRPQFRGRPRIRQRVQADRVEVVRGAAEAALDDPEEFRRRNPAARGIVSSGYHSDPVMANYRAHGFRGMVPKPYRLSDFARILREVMNGGSGL